ncbi:uncharacterized protein LOC135337079 [Halichondria panicea]|uniref:uncharacterized protein LOC135337079 n=1 Tax=Halichondria panicea TaxID=6063 RepID=UPI00312BA573
MYPQVVVKQFTCSHQLPKIPRVDSQTGFGPSRTRDIDETVTEKLTCNTKKDKFKLNYCTAGILAGVWPCGTVTMVGELFGSESLSQVYGFLFSYMHQNEDSVRAMANIQLSQQCSSWLY